MSVISVGISPDGSIAYVSDCSPAAQIAGLNASSWIGIKAWETVVQPHQLRAMHAFSQCLLLGHDTTAEMTTVIGGNVERWRVTYHKVHHPIAVMALSQKLEDIDDRILTPRERDIVKLMVADTPVAEIASLLKINESTVTTHFANLRTKLGVRTNAGIALWGFRAGL